MDLSSITETLWNEQRQELVELFKREEYGRIPDGWVSTWKLSALRSGETFEQRTYEICVQYMGKEFKFPFSLWLPQKTDGPVPVSIMISNHSREEKTSAGASPEVIEKMLPIIRKLLGSQEKFEAMCEDQFSEKKANEKHSIDIENDMEQGYWPVESLLARGWGAAAFYTADVAPDAADLWNQIGLAKLFENEKSFPDDYGCLSLWAFAASRVLDVLLDVPEIDKNRISVAGHSRFETAFVNCSGCCGAALNKGKYGENVNSIILTLGYWFCENFKKYTDMPVEEMPFDQHLLLAAMAPRPVYVASGNIDYWTDPEAEFAGCKEASPAWEALGLPGLKCDVYPEPDSVWHDGMVGYHLRRGGHALTESDWMRFCDFEECCLNR